MVIHEMTIKAIIITKFIIVKQIINYYFQLQDHTINMM